MHRHPSEKQTRTGGTAGSTAQSQKDNAQHGPIQGATGVHGALVTRAAFWMQRAQVDSGPVCIGWGRGGECERADNKGRWSGTVCERAPNRMEVAACGLSGPVTPRRGG